MGFYTSNGSTTPKIRLNIGKSGILTIKEFVIHETGSTPGSSPANAYQLYSKDWNGAGTAAPHFRTEEGDIVLLAQVATYTPTNVSADRSFDADTVLIAELADIVGTIITDLQTVGVFG